MHDTAVGDGAGSTQRPPASEQPAFGVGLRDRLAARGHRAQQTAAAASPEQTEAEPTPREEPITPELVLVDPDLGHRAREILPDYDAWEERASVLTAGTAGREEAPGGEPSEEPTVGGAEVAERVAAPAPERVLVPDAAPSRGWDEPTPNRRAKRTRLLYVASLILIAGIVAGIGWVVMRAPDVKRDARSGTGASSPSAGSTVSSAGGTPGPVTSAASSARPKPASSPRPPTEGRPRAFGWVPVKNASVYHVEFFRGTRKIFEARTVRARVTVPRRWTFGGRRFTLAPGRYRWTVRPGFGVPRSPRFGRPIVQARLVVASDGA